MAAEQESQEDQDVQEMQSLYNVNSACVSEKVTLGPIPCFFQALEPESGFLC